MSEREILEGELELIDRDLASLRGWQKADNRTIDPLLDRRNELRFLLVVGDQPPPDGSVEA